MFATNGMHLWPSRRLALTLAESCCDSILRLSCSSADIRPPSEGAGVEGACSLPPFFSSRIPLCLAFFCTRQQPSPQQKCLSRRNFGDLASDGKLRPASWKIKMSKNAQGMSSCPWLVSVCRTQQTAVMSAKRQTLTTSSSIMIPCGQGTRPTFEAQEGLTLADLAWSRRDSASGSCASSSSTFCVA